MKYEQFCVVHPSDCDSCSDYSEHCHDIARSWKLTHELGRSLAHGVPEGYYYSITSVSANVSTLIAMHAQHSVHTLSSISITKGSLVMSGKCDPKPTKDICSLLGAYVTKRFPSTFL